MKKLWFVVLLGCTVSLWAEFPHRKFEFGFDASSGFANNCLGLKALLQKNQTIDFADLSRSLSQDFKFYGDMKGSVFFNLEIPDKFGIGIFTGIDVTAQTSLPQSLIDLIAEGKNLNKKYTDSFGLGGAFFVESGLRTSFTFKKLNKLKISLQPAYYIPLLYLTRPSAEYSLKRGPNGSIKATGRYEMAVYSAFPLEDFEGLEDLPGSYFSCLTNGSGGVDLGLSVEYPLLSNLTLGASFTHIPILPAELNNKATIRGGFSLNTDDILGQIKDDGLDIFSNFDVTDGTGSMTVRRPFKAGLNAVYRPFKIRLFALIPHIGFTMNSIYDVPLYLDAGLTAELNLGDVLVIDIGSHYEDLLWKQRLDVLLNLRAFEIDLGLSLQSQEFLKSFQFNGLAVSLGLRLGW
jgi:hypothetical protein